MENGQEVSHARRIAAKGRRGQPERAVARGQPQRKLPMLGRSLT